MAGQSTQNKRVVGGRELQEGERYTLIFFEKDIESGNGKRIVKVKKQMRLVKCYTHHALLESAKGIRTSFQYWDLDKLLRGEPR